MIKKVLAIDDSALMRRVLSDIIASDERFVLEDNAVNGLEAYDLIVSNPSKYDIIILDINMPRMNTTDMPLPQLAYLLLQAEPGSRRATALLVSVQ